MGNELLAGKLKLAKVYGQEEPPAAEDELEWEVRYFVLYDSGRVLHFDDMADGLPVGDRGLIDLAAIKAVENAKKRARHASQVILDEKTSSSMQYTSSSASKVEHEKKRTEASELP